MKLSCFYFFLNFLTIEEIKHNKDLFSLNLPHWADSVIESPCLSVCVSVTIQNSLFRRLWRPLVEGRIVDISMP